MKWSACILVGAALSAGAAGVPVLGPRIEFASLVYDFGTITSGVPVKYEFVFTNTGDATLVTEVKGSDYRGDWDKSVPPGKTGKIPIDFRSASFSGPILKSLLVSCNDRTHPTTILQFKGNVWKPIVVTPMSAIFSPLANAQTNETKTLRIVNNDATPLTLSAPECDNPSLRTELKTVKEGKEFELVVSLVPPFEQANLNVPITIKTSSKETPALKIQVFIVPKHTGNR